MPPTQRKRLPGTDKSVLLPSNTKKTSKGKRTCHTIFVTLLLLISFGVGGVLLYYEMQKKKDQPSSTSGSTPDTPETPVPIPGATTQLNISVSASNANDLEISWVRVEHATSYSVSYQLVGATDAVPIATPENAVRADGTHITSVILPLYKSVFATYNLGVTFTVKAVNTSGAGAAFQYAIPAPSAPRAMDVGCTTTDNAEISWLPVDHAISYIVAYQQTGIDSTYVQLATPDIAVRTDGTHITSVTLNSFKTIFTSNTPLTFSVQAVTIAGTSLPKLLNVRIPNVAEAFIIIEEDNVTAGALAVTWYGIFNADLYTLEYKIESMASSTFVPVDALIGSDPVTVSIPNYKTIVPAGTNITFMITPSNVAGTGMVGMKTYQWSQPIVTFTIGAQAYSGTRITMYWTRFSGAKQYGIVVESVTAPVVTALLLGKLYVTFSQIEFNTNVCGPLGKNLGLKGQAVKFGIVAQDDSGAQMGSPVFASTLYTMDA
jgi:hypothetical protein